MRALQKAREGVYDLERSTDLFRIQKVILNI